MVKRYAKIYVLIINTYNLHNTKADMYFMLFILSKNTLTVAICMYYKYAFLLSKQYITDVFTYFFHHSLVKKKKYWFLDDNVQTIIIV